MVDINSGLWPVSGNGRYGLRGTGLSKIGTDLISGATSSVWHNASSVTALTGCTGIAADSSGFVYIGDNNTITKLDGADWSQKWQVLISGNGLGSYISLSEDAIYFTEYTTIKKASFSSGSTLWSRNFGAGEFLNGTVMTSGKLYVSSYAGPGKIYCLDMDSGTILWTWTNPSGGSTGFFYPTLVDLSGDLVQEQIYMGHVYGIDSASGTTTWDYNSDATAAVNESGDVILFGDTGLVCLDPISGSVKWTTTIAGSEYLGSYHAIDINNRMWLFDDSNYYYFIADSSGAKILKSSTTVPSGWGYSPPLVDQSGHAMAFDFNSLGMRYHNTSGAQVFQRGTQLVCAAAPISGGHILTYGTDKNLIRYESNPVPNPPTPTPSYYPYIVTLLDSYEQFPLNSGNIVVGSQSLYGDSSGITEISGLSSGATTFTVSVPRCQTISISKDVDDSTTGTTTIYVNRTGADKGM